MLRNIGVRQVQCSTISIGRSPKKSFFVQKDIPGLRRGPWLGLSQKTVDGLLISHTTRVKGLKNVLFKASLLSNIYYTSKKPAILPPLFNLFKLIYGGFPTSQDLERVYLEISFAHRCFGHNETEKEASNLCYKIDFKEKLPKENWHLIVPLREYCHASWNRNSRAITYSFVYDMRLCSKTPNPRCTTFHYNDLEIVQEIETGRRVDFVTRI